MDRSLCKKIVGVVFPQMQSDLAIKEWRITIKLRDLNQGKPAACYVYPHYKKASLYLDPRQADSEFELISNLRHELFHVVSYPIEELRRYADASRKRGTKKLLKIAVEDAAEHMVEQLERIFDFSLGMGVQSYIDLWEDHITDTISEIVTSADH